jgi:UDP-3-O-[3-hydroxymyristoyl] N-acetylglucosamine deacetylase
MFRSQKTINQKIVLTGKGLHTGRVVRMEIIPAEVNTGIVFQRTDHPHAAQVSALAQNISSTDLCTTIGSSFSAVGTIEHLMAAFAGLGIDNVVVKLNAPEVPIMDGSSQPFVTEFLRVGLRDQKVGKKFYAVKEAFEVKLGDKYILVEPAKHTTFQCSIDFSGSFIGKQTAEFIFTPEEFIKLCQARTFCHVNEVNALRAAGLALGGSLENAVVVTDSGVLNEEGLRTEDEFVRHKILDCIGDLALLGAPLIGKITIHKSGHSLHAKFMNELLLQKDKYLTVVEPGSFRKAEAVDDLLLIGNSLAFGYKV